MANRDVKCPKCGCDRIIKYYSHSKGECGDCHHQFDLKDGQNTEIKHQRG